MIDSKDNYQQIRDDMRHYNNYPTEPIGNGNPYHMCSYCHIPVPQINGRLVNHSQTCEHRQLIEKDEEIEWLRYLLRSVIMDLPSNKDWLNPDLEKEINSVI